MKIQYSNDEISGGGYGYLIFSDVEFPPEPLSFAIMRASDHQYATGKQNGWIGEKVFLPISEKPAEDNTLQFLIGPEIVNGLNSQETYAVSLKGGNGVEYKGRMQTGEINYSHVESLDNTGRVSENTIKTKDIPAKNTIELDKKEPEAQDKTIPLPDQKPIDFPKPEKERKSKLWLWIIILLLILGLLGWFLFAYYNKQQNVDTNVPEPKAPTKIEEPKIVSPKPGAQGDQPRILFKGKEITAKAAAELARNLPRASKSEQDDIYRLLYFAAGHGETSALMEYGSCLDPSLPNWGTIGKDAPLAYEAYTKAKAKYPKEAEKAKQHLLEWLKENAPKNNQAKIWLDEIHK